VGSGDSAGEDLGNAFMEFVLGEKGLPGRMVASPRPDDKAICSP
jgi:hypothetical protein